MHLWQTDPTAFEGLVRYIVKAAMRTVREGRRSFRAEIKPNEDKRYDVVTNVDHEVQAYLCAQLTRMFPGVGIIGEEGLSVPPSEPGGPYWTVDPVDGTVVFSRKASHGFAVMLALVDNGEVIAAFIGDVMGQVLYWFAPGTDPVCEDLVLGTSHPLAGPWPEANAAALLFGSDPANYHATLRFLCDPSQAFDGFEIDRGSIGLRAARLWNGEASGLVIRTNRKWTPWDDAPVIGFCRRLGFRFLKFEPIYLEPFEPALVTEPTLCPHHVLIVHESQLEHLRPWLDSRTGRN